MYVCTLYPIYMYVCTLYTIYMYVCTLYTITCMFVLYILYT